MDCAQAATLLSALVEGDLDTDERVPLVVHLAGCPECRASEEALRTREQGPRGEPAVQDGRVTRPSASPPSLLVVDDEPAVLISVVHLLSGDFEVVTAESADAAQAVFARRPVDLILTDQKMPRRTGVQLLEWVRHHSPRTIRLLMSSYAELEDTIDAINRGHIYQYLPKPWRVEELRHVLRNAAEKFQLERSRDGLLEEMKGLNQKLERRVLERTQELEEANHLLQQRTRELERLALMDPLTGLFNRRALDELTRFELKRHARYPSPLALGLIDVDHFKRVNTEYLHTGGDEVLKGLARLLSGSLREVDSVGRIGGEEFLVIARETGEDGAAHLAERIRATVAATPILYEGHRISVTVSIGVAVAEVGVPTTQQEAYEAAAAALAEAKRTGRNRVVLRRLVPASFRGSARQEATLSRDQ